MRTMIQAPTSQPTERDVMRAFIDRWEERLDAEYKQMGAEAKALGYKIDLCHGGSHFNHTWKQMQARIELKVML